MSEPPEQQLDHLWEQVRADLRAAVPASAFQTWLEPVEPVGIRGGRLYLKGPDRVRDWFRRRYQPMAMEAMRRRTDSVSEIIFADAPALDSRPGPTNVDVPAGLGRGLDFDRFIIGTGNRLAHSASLSVAESPGEAYNPLFIYGDPGLGKTHLLISIANYIRRQHPDLGVVYTTAERFTAEFVSSLKAPTDAAAEFKRRYRSAGALLIDDIEFLEHKPRTEDEFFHTFNELYAAGSQIVLSSDRPPEAMKTLKERLRDRFAWGLTVRVDGPDLRTRIALLQKLSSNHFAETPDIAVLEAIAACVPGNLRRLEGALTRVLAISSMLGQVPTPDLVADALGGEVGIELPIPTEELDLLAVQRATCKALRVSEADLRSSRRTPNVVRARQLGMYVARKQTKASLAEISRAFGRDHSTVLYSIRMVERRLQPGTDVHRALEAIHHVLHIPAEES